MKNILTSKKNRPIWVIAVIIIIITYITFISKKEKIKIAVLYSTTGVMAISEKNLIEAIKFAVDEINFNGGLIGHQVEIIHIDGKSDDERIAMEAEKLFKENKISALFACWTSACRKKLKPIVEKYDQLLIYVVQYEGFENSANIIYTGATPNQQIIPATNFMINRFGKKVMLIGSDYVYPRLANIIVSDIVKKQGGKILDETYFSLENINFALITKKIIELKPDFIVNTLNGKSNTDFFKYLNQAGLSQIPIFSSSLTESEINSMNLNFDQKNHFISWNYFESLDSTENILFLKKIKDINRFNTTVTAPMVSAINAVHLWADSVNSLNSSNIKMINKFISKESGIGPAGPYSISTNRNMWQKNLIGQVMFNAPTKIVNDSIELIRPQLFPDYRTEHEWNLLINKIINKNGGS